MNTSVFEHFSPHPWRRNAERLLDFEILADLTEVIGAIDQYLPYRDEEIVKYRHRFKQDGHYQYVVVRSCPVGNQFNEVFFQFDSDPTDLEAAKELATFEGVRNQRDDD